MSNFNENKIDKTSKLNFLKLSNQKKTERKSKRKV